ncbi:hypothetical protein CALVIDRAFT_541381 [Calocera viscosa TUFC12733]|uniref:SWR1-complex protein 5 n=1 Tax=Calocera viscosa (strain TUFC12733) TaxID=1330018 RepID=A0A167HVY3_CALVF|nr:hypothetical protein CALVIDRAFT_541381 [Calocera viscosa TUFC12733]
MDANLSDDDDQDYKPPSDDDSFESAGEPSSKKARLAAPPATRDKGTTDQDRQAVWEDFQAAVAGMRPRVKDIEMIEIEIQYKFVGKEIREKKMVPAGSEEAKRWSASKTPEGATTSATDTDTATALPEPPASTALVSGSMPNRPKPGPRKPRVNLISSKPKKLTMLEKSAMDWAAHLAETDKSTKEELEANRRSGGSLAKHDFLDRVGVRRQEEVEKERGQKRRR